MKDDYERNRTLIDLTAHPQSVKDACDAAIIEGVRTAHVANVGLHLMKFAGKYQLTKIGEQADMYARWLNQEYKGVLRGIPSEEK